MQSLNRGRARPVWLITIPMLAVMLGACTSSVPTSPTQAVAAPSPTTAATTRIRVADVPIVVQAPFYVALDRGYFRDEGLDVELVPVKSTPDAAILLASGQADLAGVGPDPALFNAMERGIELKMLASAAVFNARAHASGIVVRQEHIDGGRYKVPGDLKGLKIAVSSVQSQFYVERILGQAGLSAGDVEFVTLAPADMVAALKNGAIDAGWEIEPLVTALEAQHLAVLTTTGFEALPGGIPWLVVAGHTPAGQDIRVMTAFMRAVLHGIRDFYHAFNMKDGALGPVIDALAAHGSVTDRAVLEKVGMHTVDPNGTLDTDKLEAYQDYYLKTGNQKQRIDLKKFVETAPLQSALERLGNQ